MNDSGSVDNRVCLGDVLTDLAWHCSPNGQFSDCYEGLSLADYRTLKIAAGEQRCDRECSMQLLITSLGFTKGGVTRIVDRLENQGLVDRCRLAEDGRICCVLLTESGRETFERIESTLRTRIEAALERLPKRHSATLRAALPLLLAEIEEG